MKSVKQVFIADQGNATIGTALGSVAAGDFVVIEGGANTTIDNVDNVSTPFFHFALGTATTPIVSDAFTLNGPGGGGGSVATYQSALDKIVSINVGKVSCETEYMLKIRFEGEAVAKAYGYNDLIKTFSYTTDCCDPCDTACPSGSCLDLIEGLVLAINKDPEGLVLAAGVSETIAVAAGLPTFALVTKEDFETYAEFVADPANGISAEDVCDDLTLSIQGQTSDPKAVVCGQDPMSLTQTVLDFHVGLLGGFDCNGSSVTVDQEVQFAVGEPYQVANLARWAEGYKRKFGVYRVPFPYGTFESNGTIDPNGQYDIVTLVINELNSSAATLNPSLNVQEIIVAVPAGNAATVTALV
jgi:hypothetical protein